MQIGDGSIKINIGAELYQIREDLRNQLVKKRQDEEEFRKNLISIAREQRDQRSQELFEKEFPEIVMFLRKGIEEDPSAETYVMYKFRGKDETPPVSTTTIKKAKALSVNISLQSYDESEQDPDILIYKYYLSLSDKP